MNRRQAVPPPAPHLDQVHEPSWPARRALSLRRRFPGRLGVFALLVVSIVSSAAFCFLVYAVHDPTMFRSRAAVLMPIVTPLLAWPVYTLLLRLVDDLQDEIGRRRDSEAVLRMHATYDDLTGLANRRTVMAVLAQRVRDARVHAVAMFDLDHFKAVNDTYGHAVGDEVLVVVARAAQHAVGERGMVGRLGGEEFVLVIDDCDDLLGLLADVAEAVRTADCVVPCTVSIGATVVQLDDTVDSALLRADGFMYLAKDAGRDRFVVDEEILAPLEVPAPVTRRDPVAVDQERQAAELLPRQRDLT